LSDEIINSVQEQIREALSGGTFVIPEDAETVKGYFSSDERPGLLLEAKDYIDKIREMYPNPVLDREEMILRILQNILIVIAMTISKEDCGMSLVENPTSPINVPGVKEEDITEEVLAGVPKDER
jgi:hypothetical protein